MVMLAIIKKCEKEKIKIATKCTSVLRNDNKYFNNNHYIKLDIGYFGIKSKLNKNIFERIIVNIFAINNIIN